MCKRRTHADAIAELHQMARERREALEAEKQAGRVARYEITLNEETLTMHVDVDVIPLKPARI